MDLKASEERPETLASFYTTNPLPLINEHE